MEDMRKWDGQAGWGWLLGNVYDCVEFLTVCWTFLMLTIFPLYVIDGYHDIGGYKFSFFSGVSTLFLIPGLALALFWRIGSLAGTGRESRSWRRELGGRRAGFPRFQGISSLDVCVILYTVACLISYLQSDYKEDAWAGVDGWNMGLHTQLLMSGAYYLISRFFPWRKKGASGKNRKSDCHRRAARRRPVSMQPEPDSKGVSFGGAVVIGGALVGSGLTFLLGILHRFGIDPLGMYLGIDSSYQIRFLSTIGQATWYSSYVCTVLPIGLCLFYISQERKVRVWSGVYCVLGFMTLVTQNSDSAFAALALLFLGMFVASCRRRQGMDRFLECVILCAASFKAIGLLQWGFAERAMELGRLSTTFSRGIISWLLLLAASGAYLLILKRDDAAGEAAWKKTGRKLQKGALAATAGGLALAVGVIVLNTAGLLERWFGITSQNQYLLFNDKWGSDRGFTWKTAWKIFSQMPPAKKVFGAGPDCFMAYSYSIPAHAQKLNDYWKPDILTNAHNEFLNLLICVGAAGLLAWLAVLAVAALRFYRQGENRPFALMGLFAVCAYSAHNFFCYQQVCCTPFLFAILGLAEGLVRKTATTKA